MSVQVSKKKQIIFGIIVVVLILGIVEAAAHVWWLNIQDCALEESEIYEHLSQEEKRQLCQDLYNIRNSGFDLIPNQRSDSININSLGFRGPEFSPEKPTDVYRIFMIGGSTMFGAASTSDKTTIPGFLQKMFDDRISNVNVEVINAGISGGNSEGEANRIGEKIHWYDPDLIVMYDGWNDLRTQFPVLRTIDTWKQVCEFGNDEGINIVITLQPIAGFGNKILTEQEYINSLTGEDHNGNQLLQFKQSYDWLSSELKNLDDVCSATADLRGVFDDISSTIYWDQGHVGDEGNSIVSEKIYDILLPIVENNAKNLAFLNDKIDNQSIPIKSDSLSQTISFYKTPIMISHFIQNPTSGIEINNPNGKFFSLKQSGDRIFVGGDLSSEDLSKLDLANKDLTGANLSGQDLSSINLSGTILRSADLSFTNLSGQDLSGKDLLGTNFSNANLQDADLRNTKLDFINQVLFQGDESTAEKLKLGSETASHYNIVTDFSDADLTGSKFNVKRLNFIDFSNTNLKNMEFNNIQIIGSDLSRTDLSGLSFTNNLVINVNFANANLEDTNFSLMIMYESNLKDVNLKNSKIKNSVLINSNLNGANLDGVILTDVDLDGTTLMCLNHPICN